MAPMASGIHGEDPTLSTGEEGGQSTAKGITVSRRVASITMAPTDRVTIKCLFTSIGAKPAGSSLSAAST